MIGNLTKIEVELHNVNTMEIKKFVATTEEELEKINTKFEELLNQDGLFDSWERSLNKYLKCDCGNELNLTDYFTNTCSCGADFNYSGQRLADRSQWGAETGENIVDIMNGGDDY